MTTPVALTEATLTVDQMGYDAILRNNALVGEAATHVPAEVRGLASDVPWQKIIGARNRVAHAYLGIAPDTVWNILEQQIPALLTALRSLLARVPRPQP